MVKTISCTHDLWEQFSNKTGSRNASKVLRDFMRAYVGGVVSNYGDVEELKKEAKEHREKATYHITEAQKIESMAEQKLRVIKETQQSISQSQQEAQEYANDLITQAKQTHNLSALQLEAEQAGHQDAESYLKNKYLTEVAK